MRTLTRERQASWSPVRALLALTAIALGCSWCAGTARAATRGHRGGPAPVHFHHRREVCGTVSARLARCLADVVTNVSGTPQATPAPAGMGPPICRAPMRSRRRRPRPGGDGRDRRRVQRSKRGVGPRGVSLPIRTVRLHHSERVLPKGQPDRRHHLSRRQRELVAGDLVGPRHGLGDLSQLPHPARRGSFERPHRPRDRGQRGGEAGSDPGPPTPTPASRFTTPTGRAAGSSSAAPALHPRSSQAWTR